MDLLQETKAEMDRACAKHGKQTTIPDGTGGQLMKCGLVVRDGGIAFLRREIAEEAKRETDRAFRDGRGTWRHVLREEVKEAFAEDEPAKLRAELLQVAAVALRWIEAIDTRSPASLRSGEED